MTKTTSRSLAITALLALGCATGSAYAQNTTPDAADDAASTVQIDGPAVEAALRKRVQAIVAALDGKTKVAASNFDEDFLKESPIADVQKAMATVHSNVGTCQQVGRAQGPNPVTIGVLLNCQKAYVPMELAVEPKVPYRITGMLLRPAYGK
jgi:hypothetical protein